MTNKWCIEHSQYSEDTGGYPFHVTPLAEAVQYNLKDFIYNNRKQNKWQIIYIGEGMEDCLNQLVVLQSVRDKSKAER